MLETRVRFVLSDNDKALLAGIAREDGDASMSAVLRRLIRDEAERRNLTLAGALRIIGAGSASSSPNGASVQTAPAGVTDRPAQA